MVLIFNVFNRFSLVANTIDCNYFFSVVTFYKSFQSSDNGCTIV